MILIRYQILAAALAIQCSAMVASEPNETFGTATVLTPGVLLVNDLLTASHPYPDTLLGIRSSGGAITQVNDDFPNPEFGNAFTSSLQNVAVDATSVRFAITGTGDDSFVGAHSESGQYQVLVDIRNSEGTYIQSISETRALAPSLLHEFSFSNAIWAGGHYDVKIENRMPPNDIDFFTFTGLVPNAPFSATTSNPSIPFLDTVLGWYDDDGSLMAMNDDYGVGKLSRLLGMVPASGKMTFAVTGFGDVAFEGLHSQAGGYSLVIDQDIDVVPGDYNGDRRVNAADYTVWRNAKLQVPPNMAADGTGNGIVDVEDYHFWKLHYGEGDGGLGFSTSVVGSELPEPTSVLLAVLAAILLAWRRQIAQGRALLR